MAAKAVVSDVGRVLGMPYGYVDRIAKLIPFELGITLEKAIADDDELRALYDAGRRGAHAASTSRSGSRASRATSARTRAA